MTLQQVAKGARGIDFLNGFPDPAELYATGVSFACIYLKKWNAEWVAACHKLGIVIIPINEFAATSALLGASVGRQHAQVAVDYAHKYGIPAGVPIIHTHDTSTLTPKVAEYMEAAEQVIRGAAYGFAGYGARNMFDQAMARGVVFDIIWATNATSWSGGRHPDAHVWQGGHVTHSGVLVDSNVAMRPFLGWGADAPQTPPPVTPPIPPKGDTMSIKLLAPAGCAARFLALGADLPDGRFQALRCEWTGDGADPRVAARVAAFNPPVLNVSLAELSNVTLDGPLPVGDPLHAWTGLEFFAHDADRNDAELAAAIAAATLEVGRVRVDVDGARNEVAQVTNRVGAINLKLQQAARELAS